LRERARDELFKLRELAVGQCAPEIDGTDVEGGRFKLSDYRGKVVVLTFSGNWCSPCRAMYAQERALVESWKGQSFALLSVNTDPSKETLRQSLTAGEITWRCWHDGPGNLPICTRWRIKEFPTVFVLDPRGVIRGRGLRGKALELTVAELMKESTRNGTHEPFRK
jgi:thiol-disulfide isomerase/thioredoxin